MQECDLPIRSPPRSSPLLVISCGLALVACRDTTPLVMPTIGSPTPSQAQQLGTLPRPLAAALSADGQTAYVTALSSEGGAQLYSTAVGGSLAVVGTSTPLSFPASLALSMDGATLYIADLGDPSGSGSTGEVYAATRSGTLTALAHGNIQYPSAVASAPDGSGVYVTGVDPSSSLPGLWLIPFSSGTPTAVYSGLPLVAPVGIGFANDGSLYIADASGLGAGRGAIFRIQAGRAIPINKQPLHLQLPCGVAASGTGFPDLLLTNVPAPEATPPTFLTRLSPDGTQQPVALSGATLTEATSLYRAAQSDRWILIDAVLPAPLSGGTSGTPDPAQLKDPVGQVLLLTP